MFVEMTMTNYSERLATSEPTPGGGSASAVTVAMGISLVEMAIRLTKDKKKYLEYADKYEQALAQLEDLRKVALTNVDKDGEVFEEFMLVYKKKPTSEEMEDHQREMLAALYKAGAVPLETAKIAVDVLHRGLSLADIISPFVISDLIGGVELLHGAIRSALLNVAINVTFMEESELRTGLENEMLLTKNDAEQIYGQLRNVLYESETFVSLR